VLISVLFKFSIRYQLLLAPILAILLADVLCRTVSSTAQLLVRVGLLVASGMLLLAAVLIVLVQHSFGVMGIDLAAALGLGAATVALATVGWRGSWPTTAAALAVSFFLTVPATLFAVRTLVLPEQGTQIARHLAQFGLDHGSVGFIGPPPLASKVRVCAGGRIGLQPLAALPTVEPAPFEAIVVRDERVVETRRGEWLVADVSQGYRNLPPVELANALWRGNLAAYLQQHRERFQLMIRVGSLSLPLGASEEAEPRSPRE